NIMSGKRKFVPQPKVSKTHALNEDILNLIASKKQAISKGNVPKVDSNLLGDLNNILKPKTQNKNLFGGDFTENVNKILEESKNIPEVVEFIPQPVNESLLGRLDNIFKVQEKKKEEDTIIPINEEQGTYLKIEKPLTIKDGKLSVDAIRFNISSFNACVFETFGCGTNFLFPLIMFKMSFLIGSFGI
ncbi:MAG: hypothetical protein H7831_06465, partial [Magnetococcus sp. WYHC-3]